MIDGREGMPVADVVALRCDRQHLHGTLDPVAGVIEVRCRRCARARDGRLIYHRWRLDGVPLPDRTEPDPRWWKHHRRSRSSQESAA